MSTTNTIERAAGPARPVTLENGALRLEFDVERGWFDVVDKQSGARWEHDPFTASPGELFVGVEGRTVEADLGRAREVIVERAAVGAVRVAFRDLSAVRGALAGVAVETRVTLAAGADYTIDVLDVHLPAGVDFQRLIYPTRQLALRTHVDEGYLVIPSWQGCIVPSGRFKVPPYRPFWNWDDQSYIERAVADLDLWSWGGTSMPWYGSVKGEGPGSSAYLAVFDTPDDGAIRAILNYNLQHVFNRTAGTSPYPRIGSASPVWKAIQGRLGAPRRVTFHFQPGGTYATLAKRYREDARRAGRLVSLEEKAAQNPHLRQLFGAAMVNFNGGYPWYTAADYPAFAFTWRQVRDWVTTLHDRDRVDKCLFLVWGGYAKYQPESWPFDPAMGTLDQLRAAVGAAHERGYLFGFYHGYPSLLEHAPNWDPELASRHDGGVGYRWGRLCSSFYLRYAQQNLPRTAGAIGQQADYSDILTAGSLVECSHPEHPHTRAQDRANRVAVLRYVKSLGLVAGSESAKDWATAEMDYCKGGTSGGGPAQLGMVPAPLFNLVYHDCQVVYGHYLVVSGPSSRAYSEEMLQDVAFGNHPLFEFNTATFAGTRALIRDVYAAQRDVLAATATDELIEHSYLTDAFDVHRSRFSSGVEVTANPTGIEFDPGAGEPVPARGFLVRYPDGRVQRARLQRGIALETSRTGRG